MYGSCILVLIVLPEFILFFPLPPHPSFLCTPIAHPLPRHILQGRARADRVGEAGGPHLPHFCVAWAQGWVPPRFSGSRAGLESVPWVQLFRACWEFPGGQVTGLTAPSAVLCTAGTLGLPGWGEIGEK